MEYVLSVENTNAVTVAAVDDEEEAELAANKLTEQQVEWENYLMADVEEFLNVRTEADETSALAGKLRKGDVATVVEAGEEWTKISSGNLEGYVLNKYCVFGQDALAYANENCPTLATATTNGLRVRKDMNTESGIATTLYQGASITVDTTAETEDGWVAVNYNANTYYVSADYVDVEMQTSTGITVEEEAAAKAAAEEQAAKEAAELAARQKESKGIEQKDAVEAEVDDVTLLAAIIDCEAGGDTYETQLAVGAVVCNRVKSKSYPNTISKVIYQIGQFGPASSGK